MTGQQAILTPRDQPDRIGARHRANVASVTDESTGPASSSARPERLLDCARPEHAFVKTVRRSPSQRLSQLAIWFQLAQIGVTTLRDKLEPVLTPG